MTPLERDAAVTAYGEKLIAMMEQFAERITWATSHYVGKRQWLHVEADHA